MPEGPEVRRFADLVNAALVGKPIVSLTARTRKAKIWLLEHPGVLTQKHVQRVQSRGKYLIGWIESGYYFYSHLMMWGKWITLEAEPTEIDRRERARIVVPDATAILLSAPIFELGIGDPFVEVAALKTLGSDILPYPEQEPFDKLGFITRLLKPENLDRPIGAALLDQQIVAGIGNYLRAEILFDCRLDPWKKVADLTPDDLERLCNTIVLMAQRAYSTGGVTVSPEDRRRLLNDQSLVYRLGSDFGSRHYVFRRTNLPCLRCTTTIRQLRQVTRSDLEEEKTRIIYFCPTCQNTQVELTKARSKKSKMQNI
ncbi:Fpg/Nei family DNA glycosylase [Aliterella atlantica]|uniref:DNA-(apurinic or apyrimidinic site) lyase n=1 Tax=Aliterella atlantica CENA595 TaxID=1618023 RepID=A0A0D8ZT75_9CYAN|nr:DNA-formamidopyrimidine glycosylase family protein [Aliterella atlantica]KJH71572.1 hypothetical protein UH38_12350 [Aliterella atlantica CENA595]